MCGRYTLFHSSNKVVDRFKTRQVEFDLTDRYNIAPSQLLAVVAEHAAIGETARVLEAMKWGLVPSWVKDINTFKPFINARVETLSEKPSFRTAFARRRCLIPADGFYEWMKTENGKVPMFIKLKGEGPFAFGGIYETWNSPDGDEMTTCAIITVPANNFMSEIHERMPAIIRPEDEDAWLNPLEQNKTLLLNMLRPYDDDEMYAHPVSSMVNSPSIDSVRLIEECSIEKALEKIKTPRPPREPKKKTEPEFDNGQLKLF